MSDINYSIIIPHHNSPDKLQRCIDSIPTGRDDLELIIVDDNSSPDIVDFSHFPGDDRSDTVIIKTTEGKGAGYARNQGLSIARGRWLIFSDADDEFYTDVFTAAMDRHLDSSADIIYFNIDVINSQTLSIENSRLNINRHVCSSKSADIEWLRYNLTVPWGKFIKKELVLKYDIGFDEVIAGNDVMFSLQTGHYAENILIDNVRIYKWYFHQSGNITSMVTREAADSKFGVALRRFRFLEANNKLQHRSNLLINYVPFYKKTGLSFLKSFILVFNNIPLKYRFTDSIGFAKFIIQKLYK